MTESPRSIIGHRPIGHVLLRQSTKPPSDGLVSSIRRGRATRENRAGSQPLGCFLLDLVDALPLREPFVVGVERITARHDAVARGEAYLSSAVSDAVLTDYRKHVTNPIDLLSSREREVLQMIAEAKTNKEIAVVLNLSVYTIEAHRGRIMEKLNLHSTGELVRFALRNGLID